MKKIVGCFIWLKIVSGYCEFARGGESKIVLFQIAKLSLLKLRFEKNKIVEYGGYICVQSVGMCQEKKNVCVDA